MQQTEHYKLNLIETSDPFSPQPLNENTEKTEAALSGKTDLTTHAALEQRVVTLENKRVAIGTYTGAESAGSAVQTVELGFRPVLVLYIQNNNPYVVMENRPIIENDYWGVRLTENGFEVRNIMHMTPNLKGTEYAYIAFSQ